MATAKENDTIIALSASMCRKDKRKVTKKEKRKQKRKEVALIDRQIEEAQLNDPEEQRRIQLEMEMENERLERDRREFEERERLFLEALARKKAEEEELRKALEEEEEKLKKHQAECNLESNESNEWEYVEEGPPEIIWQGNEIIVKKNRVKVKKSAHKEIATENPNRPTSNPLPPQSEVFTDYQNASVLSAQQILENVAHQTPNFGTEQDKAHCPFHLKTGACRFGSRCSRVHFYPDKSCTLLMKNMYNGPGLAWEEDEGLEYTDEEVERFYEEFYEDVHTEFLKFGEIINFKVCRNGSYHLRGNIYVHYKSLDSALLAYQSINGRYFAGKQVTCEFVSVTRWKVAICGEFMKSKLKTCSRGTACNFIHCFRNPCGDYEWADWDKPPPRFWMENMAALFGYSDESVYGRQSEDETIGPHRNSNKRLGGGRERHHRIRSHSKEFDNSSRRSREHYAEDYSPRSRQRHINGDTRRAWDFIHKTDEVKDQFQRHANDKKRDYHDSSHRHNDDENSGGRRNRSRRREDKRSESDNYQQICSTASPDNVTDTDDPNRGGNNSRQQEASSGRSDNSGSHKRKYVSNDSNSGLRRTVADDSNSDLSGGISTRDQCDKYPQNDSDHVKSKLMETSSHRKKLHDAKTSEVEISDEHLKSFDRLEHGKSKEYHERSKSYDSDFSSHSSALEFEKKLHQESGSHDYREPLEETDASDRWVPDKDCSGKRHKHRRKSDRSYKKRKSKDPGSYDWSSESSDACLQESRSKGTIKSKERRSRGSHAQSEKNCKMNTTRSDSERKLKEYGESDMSHERKSDHSIKKRESSNPGSHNESYECSDGCYKVGRSRSSRKSREGRSRSSSKSREGRSRARHSSSDRKRKTSSSHVDYGKELKESCEGDRTRKRKKISLVQEE